MLKLHIFILIKMNLVPLTQKIKNEILIAISETEIKQSKTCGK